MYFYHIPSILHHIDTSQLINNKHNMPFSCMMCSCVNNLYMAYANNWLYDFKNILFIPSLKYIHNNVINRHFHIILSVFIYAYLSKVSDMFSTKNDVRVGNLYINFIMWIIQTAFVCIVIYVYSAGYILCLYVATHIISHTGEKPFKCNLYETIVYVILHILTHTGEKSYKCSLCGMVGRNELYIVVHRDGSSCLVHKALISNIYSGEVTSYCLSLNKLVALHSSMHTGEKPFKCNKCEMQKCEVLHITVHTSKESYICIYIYTYGGLI